MRPESRCEKQQGMPSFCILPPGRPRAATELLTTEEPRGLLCGHSGKEQASPTLCHHHTKQVIQVNKGLEVGSDGAVESFFQAFIPAEMLQKKKIGSKLSSFLYSGQFRK